MSDDQSNVTQIAYPDSNKIGKFNILHEILRNGEAAPMLKALFSLCVILEAYPNESGRGTTYVCASDLFQELKEGDEIPEYRIECASNGVKFDQPEHEQQRSDAGEFGFVAIRQNIVRVPALEIATGMRAPGKFH